MRVALGVTAPSGQVLVRVVDHRASEARGVGPHPCRIDRVVAIEDRRAVLERPARPRDQLDRALVLVDEVQVADRAVGQRDGEVDAALNERLLVGRPGELEELDADGELARARDDGGLGDGRFLRGARLSA